MSCAAACQHSEEECITCILQQGSAHFSAILADLDLLAKHKSFPSNDLINMRRSVELARDINYQALDRAGAIDLG